MNPVLALDRALAASRRLDADGRLHVTANISRAMVSPYLGREIPGAAALGLEPDRRYMLLRDPRELALAAESFNALPILNQHVEVNAGNPRPDLVVGATGSDAQFANPFLTNSLVVWDQGAIDAIELGDARELSCGYRYTLDLMPGAFEGQSYDGVMRSIQGSHVALVPDGRVGPDCAIDRSPFPDWMMREAQLLSEIRRRYVAA